MLPPDEWPRLNGTEADRVWRSLDPAQAEVLVVEQDDVIVGTWVLMRLVHAECVWIAPTHRGRGRVAARLVSFMRARARAWNVRAVLGHPVEASVEALIEKLQGTRLPGTPYLIPVDHEGEP